MPASSSQAILQDIFLLAGLALLLGLVVYKLLRIRTGLGWHGEGNVLTRPYGAPDALVGLGLLGFFIWLTLLGQDADALKDMDSSTYALGVFFNGVFFVILCGLLLLYMTVYRGLNPAEMFGLRLLRVPAALGVAFVWLLGVGLAIAAAMYVLYHFVLGGSWVDESPQEVVETFRKMDNPLFKLLMAVSAVIVAPVTEELIFRGFLYGVVKRYSDCWFAVLFTSLVFAAVHQHVGSLLPLFLLAVGFAIAYEATGCLLVPMFMHVIFNGYNVALLLWT